MWRELEGRRQADSLGATASVWGRNVITMVVVEEEMQKGATGKTQPTTNGRDLGMREVGVQDGTQGGPRYLSHASQGAELA